LLKGISSDEPELGKDKLALPALCACKSAKSHEAHWLLNFSAAKEYTAIFKALSIKPCKLDYLTSRIQNLIYLQFHPPCTLNMVGGCLLNYSNKVYNPIDRTVWSLKMYPTTLSSCP